MADILIRGMEIPQWCSACACNSMHYCQVLKRDVSEFLMTNKFPENCPLVPLPEKHGRLIDADALIKRIDEACIDDSWWIESRIDEMQTIVPAEGGGEDGN